MFVYDFFNITRCKSGQCRCRKHSLIKHSALEFGCVFEGSNYNTDRNLNRSESNARYFAFIASGMNELLIRAGTVLLTFLTMVSIRFLTAFSTSPDFTPSSIKSDPE